MVTMTSEVDKTQTTIAMTAKTSSSSSASVSASTTIAAPTVVTTNLDSITTSNGNNSNTNTNTNNDNLSNNITNLSNANLSNERTDEEQIPKPANTPNENSSTKITTPATIETTQTSAPSSPSKLTTSNNISGTSKDASVTSSTSSSSNNTSTCSSNKTSTTTNLQVSSSNTVTSTSLPTNTTTTINNSPTPGCSSSNINVTTPSTSSNGLGTKSNVLAVPSKNHTHHLHHPPLPQQNRKNEDAPNIMVYKKMESTIEKMQAENSGVQVRTVKAFMTKVPSVFTGADLITWILKNTDVEDVTEALHFAHLLASHGYIFPIDDHCLTVKNDGTFYRFQTPYFWPSNCWEPENTDYAVYLCKRTMQNKTRLELADYEAENLAKLQKMFSRKWEFIFMQAESQSKVAKKRDKLERKVLDSQERAFWDVHRPMPGCVNTTEIDIKKAYRRGASSHGTGSGGASLTKNPIEQLTRQIALRKQKLERRTIKVSKAAESLVAYFEQYSEFDYFITSPELPNPWQTDSPEMWDAEKNTKEVTLRRVKRWGFSLRELLIDPIGREQFTKFLEKEYSGENLKFWESVQLMKALPQSEIKEAIQKIWQEFLAPDAPCPVNVDSKSVELAREAVNSTNGPNRWCFDVAASHVYHLMKSDSYSRYLRSDMYKDYLNCSRKKIKSIPNLFGVKR